MKRVGIALVLLGVLALVFGGIRYSREKTVLDLGPIQATATEHHEIPISPIVGTVAIVGGLLLLLAPGRRTA
jgi:uncharacterized membrane protein YidH (DUF202 family)